MRISDWSSDVCSSDLHVVEDLLARQHPSGVDEQEAQEVVLGRRQVDDLSGAAHEVRVVVHLEVGQAQLAGARLVAVAPEHGLDLGHDLLDRDRKSVVSGKSVSVRVDLGCRSIIKKQKKN